jgi:hypothetical protein
MGGDKDPLIPNLGAVRSNRAGDTNETMIIGFSLINR